MKYYKHFYWVYLILAALFFYDGYDKYTGGESPWVSFLLGGLAVFMFAFRRRHIKKLEDRYNNRQQ